MLYRLLFHLDFIRVKEVVAVNWPEQTLWWTGHINLIASRSNFETTAVIPYKCGFINAVTLSAAYTYLTLLYAQV